MICYSQAAFGRGLDMLKMTKRTILLATCGAMLVAMVSTPISAQDTPPPAQDIPTNAAGEEVFSADYRPYAPAPDAVPLEPGRPNAGFQLQAVATPQVLDALSATFGDKSVAPEARPLLKEVPLLRTFRRQNALPAFNARRRAPETSDAALDPAAVLKVHYVNVGQGAGAILEFPCHTAVIDTGGEYAKGAGSVQGGKLFEAYLDQYFRDRPERRRTIDVIFTSHPHEDHLAGLREIMGRTGADAYVVKNVVDNGQTYEKGSLQEQRDFQTWAKRQGARYTAITVSAARSATGVTNPVIDPIGMCKGVDPIITGFWGAYYEKIPANPTGDEPWVNPNNHSLVLRVDFGDASFLFVGDLEDTASNEMLREYQANRDVFNVDVYAVSHHAAGDDTTDPMIKAMSPKMAIISMGTTAAHGRATAWSYGHPRLKALDVMQKTPDVVTGTRPAQSFAVASGQGVYANKPITKAIYGTGWENTIVLQATPKAEYTILSGQ
jgi:beta-lactamase superfamily II metal-dependent hydrolase